MLKIKKKDSNMMGVTDHLSELRKRIIFVIVAFILSVVVTFNYSKQIIEYVINIASSIGYDFVYLSPAELFMQYIKVSVITGIVIIVPIIFYEVWAFVRPGLKKNENLVVFLSMLMGLCFFALGAVFALYIVIPFMLGFYYRINSSSTITASISVENYVAFLMTNLLCFGSIFELPVVTTLLTQLGVIKYEWLVKVRKLVIVCIFVVAAIITPPDVVSQFLCGLPMCLLFEMSLQLCRLVGARKKKKQQAEDAELEEFLKGQKNKE